MAGVCRGNGPCDTSPTGHGGDNWVTRAGGLPPWARAIVNALKRNGHSESQAIQIMWGTVRNWARGQGNVKPETRAKAAALVAHLDAMRGAAHLSVPRDRWQSAIDLAGPPTAVRQRLVERGKAMPGGRYPIRNTTDLKKAVRAIGRTPPEKRPAVKAFIKKRAKALGATHLIPDGWSSS